MIFINYFDDGKDDEDEKRRLSISDGEWLDYSWHKTDETTSQFARTTIQYGNTIKTCEI